MLCTHGCLAMPQVWCFPFRSQYGDEARSLTMHNVCGAATHEYAGVPGSK